MDHRRVHTEECEDEGLSEDSEFFKKQLKYYQDSEAEEEADEDQYIDPHSYKGIYIDWEPDQKFQDPETGAHFDYHEMYEKLLEVETEIRKSQERDKESLHRNKSTLFFAKFWRLQWGFD